MLTLARVSKRFGALHAVSGVSLRLRPALPFGLLGLSRAGETTSLRRAAGLSPPDSGTLEFEGVGDPRAGVATLDHGTLSFREA